MKKMIPKTFVIFFLTFLMIGLVFAGDTAVVQADILDVGEVEENPGGEISIQVPDFIDLGEVNEDGLSDELKIYINNTGEVGITLTPTLIDYTDEIFTNLYFREYKTSGGITVEPQKIGSWSFDISAPSSGSFKSKYFYMQLDLRNSGVDVSSDLRGHRANVRFIATAQ